MAWLVESIPVADEYVIADDGWSFVELCTSGCGAVIPLKEDWKVGITPSSVNERRHIFNFFELYGRI